MVVSKVVIKIPLSISSSYTHRILSMEVHSIRGVEVRAFGALNDKSYRIPDDCLM